MFTCDKGMSKNASPIFVDLIDRVYIYPVPDEG